MLLPVHGCPGELRRLQFVMEVPLTFGICKQENLVNPAKLEIKIAGTHTSKYKVYIRLSRYNYNSISGHAGLLPVNQHG